MFGFALKKNPDARVQWAITLIISALMSFFVFEGLVEMYGNKIHGIGGLICAMCMIFCILYKRLYNRMDTVLLVSFFLISWISTVMGFGVSVSFFLSRFFLVWMMFLAVYYSAMAVPDRTGFIRTVVFWYSLAEVILSIYVLRNATVSLLSDKATKDIIKGCFINGRLCAYRNSNIIGFLFTSLILVSIIGFLGAKGLLKLYYIAAALVGWFCLGMCGSRTGAIGVSVSIGILCFSSGIVRLTSLKNKQALIHILITTSVSLLVAFVVLESFLLPSEIYNAIIKIFCGSGIDIVATRHIKDDNGTLSDRTLIWASAARGFHKNPRRFLFGISPLSKETIYGMYAGHHELDASHSHNTFLELIRIHGMLGFVVFLPLLVNWVNVGFKSVMDKKLGVDVRFMAACGAGILIMGIAEPVPFFYGSSVQLSFVFFIICGFLSGVWEDKK